VSQSLSGVSRRYSRVSQSLSGASRRYSRVSRSLSGESRRYFRASRSLSGVSRRYSRVSRSLSGASRRYSRVSRSLSGESRRYFRASRSLSRSVSVILRSVSITLRNVLGSCWSRASPFRSVPEPLPGDSSSHCSTHFCRRGIPSKAGSISFVTLATERRSMLASLPGQATATRFGPPVAENPTAPTACRRTLQSDPSVDT